MKNNNLPKIVNKTKICIICEGYEEYAYFERLISLNVWSGHYDFKLINAKGNGTIFARYQDAFQNDSYDIVLVFCDTEKFPYNQFNMLREKINNFHDINKIADKLVIYGNPCTMQIVIKHFCEEKIEKPSKKLNAELIYCFTGIKQYDAHKEQVDKFMNYITLDNYTVMKLYFEKLEIKSNNLESNILEFLENFESENTDWIEDISDIINNWNK